MGFWIAYINSHNYRVELLDGKIYFLEELLELNDGIRAKYRIFQQASSKGLKVCRHIPFQDERALIQSKNGWWSLWEFVTGTAFVGHPLSLKNIAKELARFDLFLDTQNDELLPHPFYQLATEEMLSASQRMGLEIPQEGVAFEFFNQEFFQKIAKMDKKKFKPRHRDLLPSNIIMQGNEVGAIADFDSLFSLHPSSSIAYAALRLSHSKEEFWEILNTYSASYPFPKEDKELLGYFCAFESLSRMSYIVNSFLHDGDKKWAFDLKKHISHLVRLKDQGILQF